MKTYLTFLILLLCAIGLAQEVPNAINHYSISKTARTDGVFEPITENHLQQTEEITVLENQIKQIRNSGNPDQEAILDLQKRISKITNQTVIEPAENYNGQVTPATLIEQFDAIGNTMILSKTGMKGMANVTEYTGPTAGRIWVVAGFQGTGSTSTPDSLRVLYSTDNGLSWISYANITLGGTDKINYGEIDMELIEGGANKFLHILYGLTASGGTGKRFSGGTSLQITGTFAGSVWALSWPGDDPTKSYYCPKITSDNVVWPSAPWMYIAVSFDSTAGSNIIHTQKFAQINNPNSTTPTLLYKADKIWWYSNVPNQQYLYTDIAFFKNTQDSLIISYSGVSDSTKVFFSKMSANGAFISPSNPGQYIGPIGGSESSYMKWGGKLSSNGNSNGSVLFIFNQKSATTNGVKYFRTTNFGNFNTMNQSIIWSAANGVSLPDIMGVRDANTHKLGFFYWGASNDSLKNLTVNSAGGFTAISGRMNSQPITTGNYGPSVGLRFVTGDSCFSLYSSIGPANLYSAFGCTGTITNIVKNELPGDFVLKQNYPNPFNPMTNISYNIPKAGLVKLVIYDVLGKEVATLVNEVKNQGSYQVSFNASNLSSGVYFYKLTAGDFSDIKRMMLLK